MREFFLILALKIRSSLFPIRLTLWDFSNQIKVNEYMYSIWNILKYLVISVMFRNIALKIVIKVILEEISTPISPQW